MYKNKCRDFAWYGLVCQVGIYKGKQESKKTRKQELDQKSVQENKKIRKKTRKRPRVLVFLFSYFLVFFYKFPPLKE